VLRYTVCVAALATMVGCASIVEGTDQNVTIITEPTGAKCDLTRDGEIIATASSTPTSVNVDKSKDDISVICTKEGHFDGAKVVESAFQGMTFGNIIFGGIIGVGVDAASGAMNEYPATVTVVLPPEKFDSASARDAFYDRQVARVTSEAASAVETINEQCDPTNQSCTSLVTEVEEERDEQIKLFEAQRDMAVVQ